MPWTAHRSPASHRGNMARISLQQSSSRHSDQRPTPRQATMDYVRGWKDSQLRKRCGRVSSVATRRRPAENQSARQGRPRSRSDVPTRGIGCGPKKTHSAMQMVHRRQNVVGSTIDQDGRIRLFRRHGENLLRPDVAPALLLQFHQPNDARGNDDGLGCHSDRVAFLFLHAFLGVAAGGELNLAGKCGIL